MDLEYRLRVALGGSAQCSPPREPPLANPAKPNSTTDFVARNLLLGRVRLPSGRILAADPIFMLDLREPFERRVPPGDYPVWLTIATDRSGNEHVAFARVVFSEEPVALWEPALTIETRPRRLPIQHYAGLGVDSGTACFIDARAARHVFALRKDAAGWERRILDCVNDHQRHGGFPALPAPAQRCMAAFASGFGDGVFDSYWGLSSNRRAVCLTLDFNVVGPPTHRRRPVPTILQRAKHLAIRYGLWP